MLKFCRRLRVPFLEPLPRAARPQQTLGRLRPPMALFLHRRYDGPPRRARFPSFRKSSPEPARVERTLIENDPLNFGCRRVFERTAGDSIARGLRRSARHTRAASRRARRVGPLMPPTMGDETCSLHQLPISLFNIGSAFQTDPASERPIEVRNVSRAATAPMGEDPMVRPEAATRRASGGLA